MNDQMDETAVFIHQSSFGICLCTSAATSFKGTFSFCAAVFISSNSGFAAMMRPQCFGYFDPHGKLLAEDH